MPMTEERFKELRSYADKSGMHCGVNRMAECLDEIKRLKAENEILKGQSEDLDRIKRMAACGTVDSFLASSDESKRAWFAIMVDESSLRKRAEEKLAECKTLAASWRDTHSKELNELKDEVMALRIKICYMKGE